MVETGKTRFIGADFNKSGNSDFFLLSLFFGWNFFFNVSIASVTVASFSSLPQMLLFLLPRAALISVDKLLMAHPYIAKVS